MALNSNSSNSVKSNEREYYEFERSPYSFVSPSALIYQATDRIKLLAKPKIRKDTTIRDDFSRLLSNPRYSGVSRAAASARCSPRVTDLALPLKRHTSFVYELPIPKPISRSALRYQPSERIHELATPKKRNSTF